LKYEKPVNVRLEKEQYKSLKAYAKLRGLDISTTIRSLIEVVIPAPLKTPKKN
jgi:hypothetical protein